MRERETIGLGTEQNTIFNGLVYLDILGDQKYLLITSYPTSCGDEADFKYEYPRSGTGIRIGPYYLSSKTI